MKTKFVIINTFIEDEDLECTKEWLEDMNSIMEEDEKYDTTDQDLLYEYARQTKNDEYNDFKEVLNFDENQFALIGYIDKWNGKFNIEPHILKNEESLFSALSYYDDIKITENGHGKVTIEMYHHDGTNKMELVQLSYDGNKRLDNLYCNEDLIDIFKNPKNRKNGRIRKALDWI